MMIPTLQLKPRLTTVHSLLLIVIRPWKFNYGNPFQQCLNVWRSPLFRHEPVCGFNKSCAYTFSKSASLKTLQLVWKTLTASPLPHPPPFSNERNTSYSTSLFASHEKLSFVLALCTRKLCLLYFIFAEKANANYLVTRNRIGKIRHECTIRRCVTYQCVDLQSIRLAPFVEFRFIVARFNQKTKFKIFPKSIP